MNRFKDDYASYPTEYLLELRAKGDDLVEEAHSAIEEIFRERGEKLPPKPSKRIDLNDDNTQKPNDSVAVKAVIFLLFLVGLVLAKTLAHTWIGVLFAASVAIFYLARWMRRGLMTKENREHAMRQEIHEKQLQEQKEISNREKLTEVMTSAANGDIDRIKELVAYGKDVNSVSASGATALIYAARNNQIDAVKYLMSVGANLNAKTSKGQTAMDVAKKFGCSEVISYLETLN